MILVNLTSPAPSARLIEFGLLAFEMRQANFRRFPLMSWQCANFEDINLTMGNAALELTLQRIATTTICCEKCCSEAEKQWSPIHLHASCYWDMTK